MKLIGNRLMATDGGQLMRKSDGILFGGSVSLGYVYQLKGITLDTPHKETLNDFSEVKALEFEGSTVYIPVEYELGEIVDTLVRLRYTASQEFSLLRQQTRKEEEFAKYDEYCELCKSAAKDFLSHEEK